MRIRVLFVLLTGVTVLLPIKAAAVTLMLGVDTVVNWDLTGEIPPPPYTIVQIDLSFATTQGLLTGVEVTLYGDLNAGGSALAGFTKMFQPLGILTGTLTLVSEDPASAINDGIFSIAITPLGPTGTKGELSSAVARGVVGGFATNFVPGVVSSTSVPEPTTLALLALAFVIVAIHRHRHVRPRGQ